MISKIKKAFLGIVAVVALMAPVALPSLAFAETQDDINSSLCTGTNLSLDTSAPCDAQTEGQTATTRINGLLTTIINIFSIIVGIVAVFMIIFGGLKYVTSGGDSGNVSSAKNTIIFALVGLVIVALAQFVVKYVLGKAAGGSTS